MENFKISSPFIDNLSTIPYARYRIYEGGIYYESAYTGESQRNFTEVYHRGPSFHPCHGSECSYGRYGGLFHADKDHWEAIGYLHDVDYEKYPNEHCHHVREFLEPEGVDEEDINTIISHGWGICDNDVEPTTDIEKSLFTVDELTGVVMAYALMRPEGITGMEVKGLKKKFKDKRFAAGCNRDVIKKGFAMLGLDAGTVMQACIDGMTAHKEELGLK